MRKFGRARGAVARTALSLVVLGASSALFGALVIGPRVGQGVGGGGVHLPQLPAARSADDQQAVAPEPQPKPDPPVAAVDSPQKPAAEDAEKNGETNAEPEPARVAAAPTAPAPTAPAGDDPPEDPVAVSIRQAEPPARPLGTVDPNTPVASTPPAPTRTEPPMERTPSDSALETLARRREEVRDRRAETPRRSDAPRRSEPSPERDSEPRVRAVEPDRRPRSAPRMARAEPAAEPRRAASPDAARSETGGGDEKRDRGSRETTDRRSTEPRREASARPLHTGDGGSGRPSSAESGDTVYRVRVGIFKEKDKAEALCEELSRLSELSPRVVKVGDTWRVQVGTFFRRYNAYRAVAILDEHDLRGIVLESPRSADERADPD